MNDNELNRITDLIWTTLNSIENSGKPKPQQLDLIKTIVSGVVQDSRKTGRTQIINHIQIEIDNLKT